MVFENLIKVDTLTFQPHIAMSKSSCTEDSNVLEQQSYEI